jgi:type I restriction enzyme S subunit
MRWYGGGPFHRELKAAMQIAKKSHFTIRSGDVIYNKLFAWKGSFGVVPPELDGMLVSDKFPTYELDRRQVDESWLRYYFRCPAVWGQARLMSTGSAALSKLTLNPPKFLHLTLPTPPLAEQQRIVARIDGLASRIVDVREIRQQAVEEANALFNVTLNRMCDFAANGTLGDVLSAKPRNGWSARCDNADGGIPVLSLGAITGFRYRSSEFKRTSLQAAEDGHFWLKSGDLLITRSNTPQFVGHAAIYDGYPAPCIYPDLMMRLNLNDSSVESKFVWYWLQSDTARKFIERKAKGTSPTMKKITQGIVMEIPFPSSLSLSRQHQIVADLDALQAKMDELKSLQVGTADELDALLPSVLSKAFTGEL